MLQALGNALCHMFDQSRGLFHLLGYKGLHVGIVERISHFITRGRSSQWVAYPQIEHIIIAHKTFLRHHTMKGVKPQVLQNNLTRLYLHRHE